MKSKPKTKKEQRTEQERVITSLERIATALEQMNEHSQRASKAAVNMLEKVFKMDTHLVPSLTKKELRDIMLDLKKSNKRMR